MTAVSISAFSDTRTGVPSPARGLESSDDHCIVECGGQLVAVGLAAVREVLSGKLATPVPLAPPTLIGVVELRGDVLPVAQLGSLLGMPTRPYTPAKPIVVLSSRDIAIGVVVDCVRHVRTIEPGSITQATHNLYRGWCARTTPAVAVLNTEALVAHMFRSIAAGLQGRAAGTGSAARSGR